MSPLYSGYRTTSIVAVLTGDLAHLYRDEQTLSSPCRNNSPSTGRMSPEITALTIAKKCCDLQPMSGCCQCHNCCQEWVASSLSKWGAGHAQSANSPLTMSYGQLLAVSICQSGPLTCLLPVYG